MNKDDLIKITKALNDEGLIIEAGWAGYRIGVTAGQTQATCRFPRRERHSSPAVEPRRAFALAETHVTNPDGTKTISIRRIS